ncbi:MAG TPA: hypothetical protein VE359_06415 [Vicinamibacteria bacterium]|nr:hypothetical protein [Vicinamibacteria bacterium]
MTARTAVRVALLALAAATAAVAFAAPRFTWENEGLAVRHPPHQGAAALLGATALAAAALPGTRRSVRVFGLAAAVALVVLGAQRLAWRVEAVEAGLHERTLTGWTRVAWREVELVEPHPDAIRVRASRGTSIDVDTRSFAPEDRTRLERTIARRVREAAQ